MSEEELREIEAHLDRYVLWWMKKSDVYMVRRLIAEVRRLQIGDAHMKATGVVHMVCQCDKCVSDTVEEEKSTFGV